MFDAQIALLENAVARYLNAGIGRSASARDTR
jgi:hypothetical protein